MVPKSKRFKIKIGLVVDKNRNRSIVSSQTVFFFLLLAAVLTLDRVIYGPIEITMEKFFKIKIGLVVDKNRNRSIVSPGNAHRCYCEELSRF